MSKQDVIIIGGGPCGLSTAIELQTRGISSLIIEKGTIVNSIYHYPTHQTFFSSSEKLAIGTIPFISEKAKPQRNDALVYYRAVAELAEVKMNCFETVLSVTKVGEGFQVLTTSAQYEAAAVVVATGYYDNPNQLEVKGEQLPHVHHYFKEAHPYFKQKVVVIGGKNSAIDAALELERAGADVTVLYRGDTYSESIKPWILPGFESAVRDGNLRMYFKASIQEITPQEVFADVAGTVQRFEADTVFAMIGYHPDHSFLQEMGIVMDSISGRPTFNPETMESNIPGIYIAGVIAAGNNANEIFIENGRFHGVAIADALSKQS